MSLINKISTKNVVGNIKKMVASESITEPTRVMRVYSHASKTTHGESDNGEWVAFLGNFKAINLLDGTEYVSGKLFLPNVASDLLEGAVEGSEGSVEFGFDIIVAPDDESAVGYIYRADSLIEQGENDPLLALESKLVSNILVYKPDTDEATPSPKSTTKKSASK